MYDGPMPPERGGVSVLEVDLERLLRKLPGRPVVLVDYPPHGRRPAGPPPVEEPGAEEPVAEEPVAEDPLEARMSSFAELLETGAGHLAVAAGAYREQSRQAAVQARAVAAFAACRPAAVLDRPDDEVGAAAAASRAARPAALTSVSEWAVDEVMATLGLSSAAAARLLEQSVTIVEQLPATLAALEAGTISWAHAVMLADVLPLLTDPATRAEVEAALLGRAAGKTVPQLREAARRAVLRADASAAVRRAAVAIRDRQVRMFPGRDGMASLTATMPIPLAAACRKALAAHAEAAKTPGDERTRDQRMLDCLADLILRPDATRPPVGIDLQVIASVATLSGGDEPGEVDGHPVPAELVRELAYALGLLPRPTAPEPETARAEPPAARLDLGPGEAVAAGLTDLLGLRTIAGTALTHLPTIAVVDEISGQLLALTNAIEIQHAATCGRPACRTGRRTCDHPPRGPGLGPPPPTAGYSPSAPLQRFVRARDRRCRFPGCRAAAIRCDLDHNLPWPAGATSADNLCLSFPRFLGVPDAWSGGQAERGPPMPRSPLKYPLEVRQRAVDMVQTSGRPIASVAQELGLNPETLRKWVKAKESAGKVPADELATPAEKDAEIRRLRAEVAELRRTNEILRLASAYFAQELGPARRSETSR